MKLTMKLKINKNTFFDIFHSTIFSSGLPDCITKKIDQYFKAGKIFEYIKSKFIRIALLKSM